MDRRECMLGLLGTMGAVALGRAAPVGAAGPEPLPSAPMIAGPDPDPRTPAFKAPKGTVDTHYGASVSIAGDNPWPGGQTPSIYQDGAVNNARAFITGIESGKPVNSGREGALSTQTCVLGRVAAYKQKEVTWAEVDAANEKLDLGL